MERIDKQLHDAVRQGDAARVSELLAQGANPGSRNANDSAPLQFAASRDHWPVCEILLRAGAPVDAATKHGWTALMSAAESGKEDIVRKLVDAGGDNALFGAVRNRHRAVVACLLDLGVQP